MWHEVKVLCVARCLVLFALFSPAILFTSCSTVCAAAQATDAHADEGLYKQIEDVVRQYYPKAKVARSGSSLHFEFKVKSEVGFYADSGRSVMEPQDGGILGDLSIIPGEYAGTNKLGVDANGFHSTLTLAPYSPVKKAHLLATLIFPGDMSTDFESSFRKIVGSFAAGEANANKSQSTQPAQDVGASSASTTAKDQVKAPEPNTKVFKKNTAGSNWSSILGTADGTASGAVAQTLPADPIELTSYRYLPGYPGKVTIVAAKQANIHNPGSRMHVVDLSFRTKDPADEVSKVWTKGLADEHWSLVPNQRPGVISGYVNYHVTDEISATSGKWSSRSASAHDADVTIQWGANQSGGTDVKIHYSEPEQ